MIHNGRLGRARGGGSGAGKGTGVALGGGVGAQNFGRGNSAARNAGTGIYRTGQRSGGGGRPQTGIVQGGGMYGNISQGGGGRGGVGGVSNPTPVSAGATPGGSAGQSAGALANYGQGLLDPGSDLSNRWMEQLREGVGDSTDAAQRAAGYQAAQQGFGGGASPELLEMQNALGQQGLESQGQAASDYQLQAPGLGIGALGGAMNAQVGMRGQDLSARTAEMNNLLSREQSNAGLQMQQRNIDLNYNQLEQDRYLRELMLQYGGY